MLGDAESRRNPSSPSPRHNVSLLHSAGNSARGVMSLGGSDVE
jgi:hypothetical protein